MTALAELPRSWWAGDLPGHREHLDAFATYSKFAYDELPPIARTLDAELNWLRKQSVVPQSLGQVDRGDPEPTRPATGGGLDSLMRGSGIEVPLSFTTFIRDTELRKRIRSPTACYLDLGEFRVDVPDGGALIHFLSDQQWVLHWLLYVGPAGAEAVVVTSDPFGFETEERRFKSFDAPAERSAVCAESFSEFLYRLWIENEIWFRTSLVETREPPLTDEQRRYAEHYH